MATCIIYKHLRVVKAHNEILAASLRHDAAGSTGEIRKWCRVP